MAEHKEYWSTTGDQGTVKISEDVVASIAALAATDTDGVSSLCASLASDLVGLLGKKSLNKGVKVEFVGEDEVAIEICFLARYGVAICDVAKKVQMNVRQAIASMTGLIAVQVNVHVCGVTFEQPVPDAVKTEE